MTQSDLYIGLMSGTSLDGVDAVIVDFTNTPSIINSLEFSIPPPLRQQILSLCQPGDDDINAVCRADVALGKLFAESVNALLCQSNISSSAIRAIGSHGQTVRHHPEHSFTLQLGDSNIICEETGIDTVSDFRRRDISAGGQGAPLVPAFHQAIFRHKKNDRVVLNIGGMANITLLSHDTEIATSGHDTGPGNVLMDAWIQHCKNIPLDIDGNWAEAGNIDQSLLASLLSEAYFEQLPPKSTGRELFNISWLQHQLSSFTTSDNDIQTTLAELTALSIANDISSSHFVTGEVLVCGGGANNAYLMSRIQHHLPQWNVLPTERVGVDGNALEAMAFAWLAKQCIEKASGNLAGVTGAKGERILGAIYQA